MNEESAFLRAIAEAPDDELGHLVFADWLEENGDGDRAELIRLQIVIHRLSESDPQRQPMLRREKAIFARLRDRWFGTRSEPHRADFQFCLGVPSQVTFRRTRGFEEATVRSLETLPITRAVFAIDQPTPVRTPDFARSEPEPLRPEPVETGTTIVALLAMPWFSRVREIALVGEPGSAIWRILHSSRRLQSVRSLSFCDVPDLDGNRINAILRTAMPHLESLRLRSTGMNAGLTTIAADPFRNTAVRLERFALIGALCERFDLLEILKSPSLELLRSLELSSDAVTMEIGRAIASSHVLRELRTLRIEQSELGDTGAYWILRSRNLRKLRRLTLASSGVEASSFARIPGNGWPELEEIDLSVNPLRDAGLGALIRWKAFDTVRFLNLRTTFIGAAGLKELVFSQAAANLEWIDLGNNDLGIEGLRMLADHADRLPKLRWLKLGSNRIRGAVAAAIRDTGWANRLEGLDLWNNPLTSKDVAELRLDFGDRLAFED